MRYSNSFLAIACVAALSACSGIGEVGSAQSKPNVLLVVADDLGYSDLGAFGSEIRTPNLDALAKDGRVLTNFHTSPNCSPTRAMLMSGTDSHKAGLGSMAETTTALIQRDVAPFGEKNTYGWSNLPPGYQGFLNDGVHSLPSIFRDGGYHTYMVGKWHLATKVERPQPNQSKLSKYRPESLPGAKGFERSFALMEGGASHFAPVPGKLTAADIGATYIEDDKPTALPQNFYSSNFYTDRLIQYIESNRKTGRPFFAYAAYTAPHFPLHAPDEDILRQKGRYDVGYDVVRQRRLEKQVALGILPVGTPVVSSGQGPNTSSWNELSAMERTAEARKMEVYAAMVENLDANVGRLIAHLKSTGQYDNTVVVFMSDNGAHPGPRSNFADNEFTDNSLENMGRPRSNVTYGPRWAEVSSTPFRMWKRFSTEGGTSAPLIVRMPGKSMGGGYLPHLSHVTDILPTLTDVAGLRIPNRGMSGQTLQAVDGLSLKPYIEVPSRPAASRLIAGELFGGRYINDGQWKLLSLQPPQGDDSWMLFDMATDRGETTNLAAKHPQEVERLKGLYGDYSTRVGLIALPPGTRIPAAFD